MTGTASGSASPPRPPISIQLTSGTLHPADRPAPGTGTVPGLLSRAERRITPPYKLRQAGITLGS